MKKFVAFINEKLSVTKAKSYLGPQEELKWNETFMHFKNGAALFMFDAEMMGQISDGKYENSGPRGHYKWLQHVVYCIDGEEYHSNYSHDKRYNLNEWVRNVKSMLETGEPKDNDYDFTIRMYDYGKAAHILGDRIIYDLYRDKKLYSLRSVIGELGNSVRQNKSYEDFVKSCKEKTWVANYFQNVSTYINEDFYNKFIEYDYSFKEFRNDEKSMEATVNTYKANN